MVYLTLESQANLSDSLIHYLNLTNIENAVLHRILLKLTQK